MGGVEEDASPEIICGLEFEVFLPFGVLELLVESGLFEGFGVDGFVGVGGASGAGFLVDEDASGGELYLHLLTFLSIHLCPLNLQLMQLLLVYLLHNIPIRVIIISLQILLHCVRIPRHITCVSAMFHRGRTYSIPLVKRSQLKICCFII